MPLTVVVEPRPPDVGEDTAWVGVETTLSLGEVTQLITQPDRILRVNPHWVFETWNQDDDSRFQLRVRNQANGQIWETGGSIARRSQSIQLNYDDGIKASTRFTVEAHSNGSRIWVVDDYGRLPTAEREKRLTEVDPSLPDWGSALKRYLDAWDRRSGNRLWRWYMEGPWCRMTPLGRRVARLLIWATVAELALFLLLVAILIVEIGT